MSSWRINLARMIVMAVVVFIMSSVYAQEANHNSLSDTDDLQNDREIRVDAPTAEDILLFYRVDGGSFTVVTDIDNDNPGVIPPFPPGSLIEYYIEASDAGGNVATSPFDAPLSLHSYRIIDPPSGGGKALSLDGDGDYVTLGNDLNLNNDATVSVWIKSLDVSRSDAAILGKYQTNHYGPYDFYLSYNHAATWISDGSGSYKKITGVKELQTDVWYNITWVLSGGINSIFMNGELDVTGEIPNLTSNTDLVTIGRQAFFFKRVVEFHGSIDELRIWSRPLSQEEIQTNLHRNLTGSEEGLVGYWTFDELNANGLVPDLSGNDNHGTLMGDASLVASEAPLQPSINRGFTHSPIDSILFSEEPHFLSAELLSYRRQATTATLFYRTDEDDELRSVEMSFDNGVVSGEIPPFPRGTIIEYYFQSSDELGDLVAPANAPVDRFSYLIYGSEIKVSPNAVFFGMAEIAQAKIETLTAKCQH